MHPFKTDPINVNLDIIRTFILQADELEGRPANFTEKVQDIFAYATHILTNKV